MHEPDAANWLPPSAVKRPWLLSMEEQARLGPEVGVGGSGMPASVDLVMVEEGRREALW